MTKDVERFKIVMLGDSSVGKTTLVSFYANAEYVENPTPTINAGFFGVDVVVNGTPRVLDIWDTAGQESYNSMVPMYLNKANGALLVFDVTSRKSFENLLSWCKFLENGSPDMYVVVFGNKTDLPNREIDPSEAINWASNKGFAFMEGSVYEGKGVREVFDIVVEGCVSKRNRPASTLIHDVDLSQTEIQSRSSCCF